MTGSFVIKKNRILEILFFIIIFLVNLKMTLNISDFATANLSILIIGVSFISLLFTKIDDNIYWIVLFFILSLFRVEASKMLFVSLLVSISRNLYIDKMAKYSFCLTVLFLIINYGLLILGVLHEEYSDFFYKSGGVVSDMGYGNPNLFSLYLFFLVIFLVVLKKEINTFLVAFIVFVIYESFYSRTVLFSGCILLVLSFVQKTNLKKCFFNKYILLSYPFVILFFFIVVLFNESEYSFIHEISSGRLRYSLLVFGELTPNNLLIGATKIDESIIIDVAYISLLLSSGIFSLAYLYNLYCKAVSKFDYNSILIPVMLQYLFLSLSESAIINTYLWGGLFFWIVMSGKYSCGKTN